MLSETAPKPPRPWKEVAEEVCREPDQEKLSNLLQELDEALDRQRSPNPHG